MPVVTSFPKNFSFTGRPILSDWIIIIIDKITSHDEVYR
jgi:hypothetical protein